MSEASSSRSSIPDPLAPPLEALYWTQYSVWYPIFRRHAPKSTVIDIAQVQPELLGWLESETFVLPEGSGPSTLPDSNRASSSSSLSSDEAEDDRDAAKGEGDSDEEEEQPAVRLDAMDSTIRSIIAKYDGGPIFPKLNWSAPLDAAFMLAGNTLQCLHPEDVYLLLKSSEFVGRDLEQISHTNTTTSPITDPTISSAAIEEASRRISPQLVLKKWFALNKSHEFRCFVRSHQLIAITQRDVTFFDHLQSPLLQSEIKAAICDFYEDVLVIAQKEGKWGLGDYIFDVYLTKDLSRVWLVDVNAWLPRTDPLLFGWEELEELHLNEKAGRAKSEDRSGVEEVEEGVVRLSINGKGGSNSGKVEDEEEVQRGEADIQLRILSDRRLQSAGGTGATYSSNMVPKDLVDFAKTSGSAAGNGRGMSVDQIVSQWNAEVDSEDN
ncbi:hypothetical protein PSEUBRA_001806 [Kalmanozyma brasiliensis GHG001]|uniref:Uncharacterized protein n=1 Tax=Kalmanozyma brasiliensis (strain GHG001) TaxID=1365824 RepID=V5F0I0_KALBG|nr:uncharacterized protein PSEUBRA_001806 [Kalmanozyma brasiliensis GHG001]EST08724.1 hypothetical protein PSEUBRA_001806 [Kalmanozyma brasiliensis GHG001]